MSSNARAGMGLEVPIFWVGVLLLVAGHAREVLQPAPYEPRPQAADVLRVVTWNVGGEVAEGASALRPEHVEQVAATLALLEADLILLQEVSGARQLGDLRRHLGAGWESAISRSGRGRRVGLLARTADLDRLAFESDSSRNAASTEATASVGRGFAAARFVSRHGVSVCAVGIHASAFSSSERNREVGLAVDQLAARASGAEVLVLAGDFNLDLDLGKRSDLFTDDRHLDVETYNYAAQQLLDVGRGRGATADPDRRLDYVFVGNGNGNGAPVEVRAAGPWKGRRIADMDHDPVVADVVLAPRAASR